MANGTSSNPISTNRGTGIRLLASLLVGSLAAALLGVLQGEAGQAQASGGPSSPVFAEDFSTQTLGAYPSSFDTESVAPPYLARTIDAGGSQGHALGISRSSASDDIYYVNTSLSSPVQNAGVSFKASVAQTGVISYIPEIRGPGGTIARMAFYNDGTIRVFQGSWITVLDRYLVDHWYSFEVLVDTDEQTFAVRIDGELVGADYAFQSSQTAVSRLRFGLFRGLQPATLRLDDLEVRAAAYQAVQSVALPGASLELVQGSRQPLPLEVTPSGARLYETHWSSLDESIAVVEGGAVHAVGVGSTTIEATVRDSRTGLDYTATRDIEVTYRDATGVTVSPGGLTLPVEASEMVTASVAPADASTITVEWTSSDEGVAVVNGAGSVTAIAPGTAVVTATSDDGGFTATSTITVVARQVVERWYVDPDDGDDDGAGTLADPLQSLVAAQEAFRTATSNGTQTAGDAEIVLRGGTYELEDTFVLDERDSSDAHHRLVIRAYAGESPVLSGGRVIDGWQLFDTTAGIYRAPSQGFETRQLYIDGVRATRARSEGSLADAELTAAGVRSDDVDLLGWSQLEGVEFVFQERWTQPRATVQSAVLSSGGQQIDFTMHQPGWGAVTTKGSTSPTEGPIYIENALELLDDEGEWYLDDEYFYYKPRAFESMNSLEIVAPVLEQLVLIDGASKDERVGGIAFEGITFAYATWMQPSSGWGLPDTQSNHLRYPGEDDVLIPAAVTATAAHEITFSQNTFSHLGATGLHLIDGVQDSTIQGNHFFDISGGALNVGKPTRQDPEIYAPSDPLRVMARIDVLSNYIHDIGVEYGASTAIVAGFPVDLEISNNHIFNVPYSGISIGYGGYNFQSTGQKDVLISGNYIHDLMGSGINDGGAIYMTGYTGASPERMNQVVGNYLQNQKDKWGVLYADNAANHWAFTGNVIDQEETPVWDDFPAYWAFGKEADLLFDNNFTTTPHVNTSFTAAFPVTNTQLYPDADWPLEAQTIIDDAGLLPPDSARLGLGVERVDLQEEVVLEESQTEQLVLGATRAKGAAGDLSGAQVLYRSLDPSVATVSSSGLITAVADGRAVIETRIVMDELMWSYTTIVYVGDELVSIELRTVLPTGRAMIVEENLDLGIYGLSDLGREIALEELTVTSSDDAVVEVQPDDTLLALEEGEVVITIATGSQPIIRTLEVKVVTRSSEEGLALAAYPFDDELADAAGWSVTSGTVTVDSAGVRLATPAGQGSYVAQSFGDELLSFDLTIEGASGWEAIQIRNQNSSSSLQDTYAIVIKPTEIELHRFNNGQRTVIFGTVTGFTSIGGGAYPNDVLPFGERKEIQLGAINEPGGVRIVLNVDDTNVFYYLDTDADRIEDPGYLSVMARYWTVLLSPTAP